MSKRIIRALAGAAAVAGAVLLPSGPLSAQTEVEILHANEDGGIVRFRDDDGVLVERFWWDAPVGDSPVTSDDFFDEYGNVEKVVTHYADGRSLTEHLAYGRSLPDEGERFPVAQGRNMSREKMRRVPLSLASASRNVSQDGTGFCFEVGPVRPTRRLWIPVIPGGTTGRSAATGSPGQPSGCFTRRWRSSRSVSARSASMSSGCELRTVAGDYVTTALRRRHTSTHVVTFATTRASNGGNTVRGVVTQHRFQPLPRTMLSAGSSMWSRTTRATRLKPGTAKRWWLGITIRMWTARVRCRPGEASAISGSN